MVKAEKWWEQYYVRYYVGAAFAVPLLILLSREKIFPAELKAAASGGWLNAAVVSAAGLAFCYIASAPILLMHACRGRFPKSKKLYNGAAVLLAFITLIGLISLLCPISADMLQKLRYVPYILVVGVQIILLGTMPLFKEDGAQAILVFYDQLGEKRAYATRENTDKSLWSDSPQAEYVESYRHLREHGNAFSILVLEAILVLALSAAKSMTEFFAALMVWIVPAAFAWLIGTWLERSLKGAPP